MPNYSGEDGAILHGSTVTITNATHDAGVVTVTAASHGRQVGDIVRISSVVGMTDLNSDFVIQSKTTNDFTVSLTTAQTYTSGGSFRTVFYITNWTATIETDLKNITDSSCSGWEESIPSEFTRASGGIDGFMKNGSNIISKGESISVKLEYNSVDHWDGNAIVTSDVKTLAVSGGDALKYSLQFTGTGTWSETNS